MQYHQNYKTPPRILQHWREVARSLCSINQSLWISLNLCILAFVFVFFASRKAITLEGCRKIKHKSIHGSVVTPLSCHTSPIICPMYNQTDQFQRNKSLEIHVECIWDKQFHHSKLFANSKTQFWCFPSGGLSNSIWCWQYRRFNLWYCCHQIVWSALWVVHCFYRYHIFSFYIFLSFVVT